MMVIMNDCYGGKALQMIRSTYEKRAIELLKLGGFIGIHSASLLIQRPVRHLGLKFFEFVKFDRTLETRIVILLFV